MRMAENYLNDQMRNNVLFIHLVFEKFLAQTVLCHVLRAPLYEYIWLSVLLPSAFQMMACYAWCAGNHLGDTHPDLTAETLQVPENDRKWIQKKC